MGNTRWLLSLSLMGSLDAQRGPMLPATPVDRALIAFRERYAGLTVRAPFRMDGNPAYTGSNGIYFVDNPYSYIACTLQFYWLNRSCSDQPVALNTPGSPPCGPAVDVATIR